MSWRSSSNAVTESFDAVRSRFFFHEIAHHLLRHCTAWSHLEPIWTATFCYCALDRLARISNFLWISINCGTCRVWRQDFKVQGFEFILLSACTALWIVAENFCGYKGFGVVPSILNLYPGLHTVWNHVGSNCEGSCKGGVLCWLSFPWSSRSGTEGLSWEGNFTALVLFCLRVFLFLERRETGGSNGFSREVESWKRH